MIQSKLMAQHNYN